MLAPIWSLVVLLAGLTTVAVSYAEYRRTGDLVTPLHLAWYFFAFFFLSSYLVVVQTGATNSLHPFDAPISSARVSLLHLFGAMVVLTLGYYRQFPVRLGQKTVDQLPERRVSPRIARLLGLTLLGAGGLSVAVFVEINGGLAAMLEARNVFAFRTAPDSLRWWLGLQIGLFGGLALYLSGARHTDGHLLAYGLCLAVGGLFFVMHTRSRALFAVLLLFVYAWHADDRITVSRLLLAGATVVGLFVLFRPVEMVLQGRSLSHALAYLEYYTVENPGGGFFYTDFFQGYMGLVEGVPDRVPYQWGRTFVGVPWVPGTFFDGLRRVAPDPWVLTEVAIYGYDRPNTGTAASGFGALLLNFTVYGMLVASFVLGGVLRWSNEVWKRAGADVFVGALYFVLLYGLLIALMGTLLPYNVLLILLVLRGVWGILEFVPDGRLDVAVDASAVKRFLTRVWKVGEAVKMTSVRWTRQARAYDVARRVLGRLQTAYRRSRLSGTVGSD